MRTWITGMKTYRDPVLPGMVMAATTIAQVVFSKNQNFQKGDLVICSGGWQKYAVLNGK